MISMFASAALPRWSLCSVGCPSSTRRRLHVFYLLLAATLEERKYLVPSQSFWLLAFYVERSER